MGRMEADGGFFLVLALMLLLFPLGLVAGIVLAALIHECGHLMAVRLTGGSVLAIRLHAGGARIDTAPMEPGKAALCALAGPAAGALTIFAWRFFPKLALAGLVQTVFNLLPIYPLDGGRVARNICCKLRDLGVQ